MGRGSSGAGAKSAGGGGAAKTPSGVTYDQFMQMTDDQKYNLMDSIILDPNLKTPDTMDDSDTSKVLYALGVTNKPTVVDDATLDNMSGTELLEQFMRQVLCRHHHLVTSWIRSGMVIIPICPALVALRMDVPFILLRILQILRLTVGITEMQQ